MNIAHLIKAVNEVTTTGTDLYASGAHIGALLKEQQAKLKAEKAATSARLLHGLGLLLTAGVQDWGAIGKPTTDFIHALQDVYRAVKAPGLAPDDILKVQQRAQELKAQEEAEAEGKQSPTENMNPLNPNQPTEPLTPEQKEEPNTEPKPE